MQSIQNRLRRIEGQLKALQLSCERGESCEKIIPQFLAVKGAVDASLQHYLKESLATCREKKTPDEIAAIMDLVIKKLA